MALPQTKQQWDMLAKAMRKYTGPSVFQRLQQSGAARKKMLGSFFGSGQSLLGQQPSISMQQYNQMLAAQQAYSNQTTSNGLLGVYSGSGGSVGSGTWVTTSTGNHTTTAATTNIYSQIPQRVISSLAQQQIDIDPDAVLDHAVTKLSTQDLLLLLKDRRGKVDLFKGNDYDFNLPDRSRVVVERSGDFRIDLKDGTSIYVESDRYRIEDQFAKVTYKAAPVRDFNPFINASDKLEAFIDYCATHGVTKEEMVELPVKLFINWLIIEAAKTDREAPPDLPTLPAPKEEKNECLVCHGGITLERWDRGIRHCSPACFSIDYEPQTLLLEAAE